MWQMAQLLAGGKADPDVKEHTADLDMSGVALKPLLPENTGFQLLIQPLKARGLGLRLKRKYSWNQQHLHICCVQIVVLSNPLCLHRHIAASAVADTDVFYWVMCTNKA